MIWGEIDPVIVISFYVSPSCAYDYNYRSSNSANTLSASGLMQSHIGKSHFSKVLAQRNSTAAQIILPASHAGNYHW